MRQIVLTGVTVALAVFAASKWMPGVKVRKPSALVVVALIFGVLNAVLGGVVRWISTIALIPVAIVTLGLVYLFLGVFVNAFFLWITDKLMDDFEIKNARSLFGTAVLVSVAGWILQRLVAG